MRAMVIGVSVIFLTTITASAAIIEANLTAEGLGLTNDSSVNINKGSVVDADQAGLITSPTIGMGSILTILDNGLAGNPGGNNSLFVTVTANSRTDNFPDAKDYQAGIIMLTKQENNNNKHADKGEGLGIRAFTVINGPAGDASTGLRQIDGVTGRAKIEGSKHISGGVENDPFDPQNANDAEHVDEIVFFDFNYDQLNVDADSFVVRFSEMDKLDGQGRAKDHMNITLTLGDDTLITLSDISIADTDLFSLAAGGTLNDKVWDLNFSGINDYLGITALDDTDVLKQITVQSTEAYLKNAQNNQWEKSHFFINTMSADVTDAPAIPEPGTLGLILAGGVAMIFRRSKSKTST